MDRFVSHGVDTDYANLYRYTKDRDKALASLGPRIMDAVLPGLNNSVPTTGIEMSKGSLSYQHLLVSGKKATPCSADLLKSKEERLKYVDDISVTCRVLDQTQ